MTNRAAVLVDLRTVVLEDRPEPEMGPRDVVVAVRSVGVCGSDVHYYREGRIGDFVVEAPLILGHEAAGVVVAAGELVTRLNVGQRVTIEPGVPDGTCVQCQAGRYNLCPEVRFLATPPVDGAFIERISVPEAFAHPVPDLLSDDAAALIEPLSVAVAACRVAAVGLGSSVLVTGAGPIGVLVAQLASCAGARRVLITDPDPDRRQRATRLTSAEVWSPAELPAKLDVDAFIECSGSSSAVTAGLHALAPASRAVLVGMGAASAELPVGLIQRKELIVTGTFRYANTYPMAIALAASGRIDLDLLVDRVFGLAEVGAALDAGTSDRAVMKAIVRVQT